MNLLSRVFPAPAGINRIDYHPDRALCRVPRASGDKPYQQFSVTPTVTCSPRQRG
ncbi:TPA: hypothetical protein ACXZV3_001316 [Salmonella enterica]